MDSTFESYSTVLRILLTSSQIVKPLWAYEVKQLTVITI